jgi:hypothetical protein
MVPTPSSMKRVASSRQDLHDLVGIGEIGEHRIGVEREKFRQRDLARRDE